MKRSLLSGDLLNCVIAIGLLPDQNKPPKIMGTGVLVEYAKFLIIVTTKHVVEELIKIGNFTFFNNAKDGRIVFKEYLKIKEKIGQDWIFHPNPHVDLAVNFFVFDPKIDDIKIIPQDLFAKESEIEIGGDAYVLGYPYGISSIKSVIPIVRRALIAGKSYEGHYFVDAALFQGNSGGPIFLRPSIQSPNGTIVIGGPLRLPKLIGFVKSIIENKEGQSLHLSEIIGIQKLTEIFSTPEFNDAVNRMKDKFPKNDLNPS